MEKERNTAWAKAKEEEKTNTTTDHLKTNYSDKSLLVAWQLEFSFFDFDIYKYGKHTLTPIAIYSAFSLHLQTTANLWPHPNKKKSLRIDSPRSQAMEHACSISFGISDLGGAFSRFCQNCTPFRSKWLNLWIDYRTNWRPGNLYPRRKFMIGML